MIAALDAAVQEIGRQEDESPKESRPTMTGMSEDGTISIEGVLNLKALVEAILDVAGTPRTGMVALPIFTMNGIARDAAREAHEAAPDRSAPASPWPAAEADDGTITMWVVTSNPADFPGKHVARKWLINGMGKPTGPTAEHIVADTLEELRTHIPPGLTRLERQAGDDPTIVECWL